MSEPIAQPDDRARLDSAVKDVDGFFTTFFVSPYSKHIARWCARRGYSPNQVTLFSMALGVLAAAGFATGQRAGLVAGAVLLQASFTMDCVDGQLARYTQRFSARGAWLDSVFDRLKEYLAYGALAVGASRAGDDGTIWVLATAALALQTIRHAVAFSWAPAPGEGAVSPLERVAVGASAYAERRPWLKWPKRIIVLPVGERLAVISVTAAAFNARVTFTVLLGWGLVALLYAVAGRLARPSSARRAADVVYDHGPLSAALSRAITRGPQPRPPRRLTWLWPAALRLFEYGVVLGLAHAAGLVRTAVPFLLVWAMASRYYGLVYGARYTGGAGDRLRWARLGWEGRVVLLSVLAATGLLRVGALALAGWLAGVVVADSVVSWSRAGGHPAAGPQEET